MKLSITHLTFLNLNLIHVIDCGYHDGVTVEEVKSHIKNGDVLDWLGSRFKGRIDPGCTYAQDQPVQRKITEGLQDLLGAYGDADRKWGVKNNGICLLLTWTNELVQQRARE